MRANSCGRFIVQISLTGDELADLHATLRSSLACPNIVTRRCVSRQNLENIFQKLEKSWEDYSEAVEKHRDKEPCKAQYQNSLHGAILEWLMKEHRRLGISESLSTDNTAMYLSSAAAGILEIFVHESKIST